MTQGEDSNMPEGKKIGMVGGDGRMGAALRFLLREAERDNPVLRDAEFAVWGAAFDGDGNGPETDGRAESSVTGRSRVVRCADAESAVREADAVILPLPVTRDGGRLNAPGGEKDAPRVVGLAGIMKPGAMLFGGRIPETVREAGRERGILVTDYFEDEAFQLRNAVLTAEGALAALIDAVPSAVSGLRCAVLGYGRVGSALARRLVPLGAEVTAAARNERDRARAESDGCSAVPLDDWRADPGGFTAVFNTIPAKLLDGEILGRMDRGTVVFDLAPGESGIGPCEGVRVIPLPGLPGKCAPVTAGEIIARSVLSAMERKGGL